MNAQNVKRCWMILLSAGSLLCAVSPARADDIDERQAELASKINQASSTKRLNSKDTSQLRKEMGTFNEKKTSIRAAHGDVLHLADDKELNTLLSDINQHYEEKVKPAGEKSPEAPDEKSKKAEKHLKKDKAAGKPAG